MASTRSFGSKSKKADQANLDALKSHLSTGIMKGVYLLSGEERFLVDYYFGEIKRAVLGGSGDGLNLVRFEGRTDVERIIDACETFPIFSEKKLVAVKNAGFLAARKKPQERDSQAAEVVLDEENEGTASPRDYADEGSKAQEALKQYIPGIPASTCLVLLEDNPDKRLGLYKVIQKYGLHIDFPRQGPDELAAWVIKGFRRNGKAVSPDAAHYLVDICDNDMYAMRNEIAKIALYVGDKPSVDKGDIRAATTTTIKSVVFDLMDAVADRNPARALALLDDMMSLREPVQKILAMISKQTGEMLKLRRLMDRRIPPSRISEYFQGKHPYAFRKLSEQAGKSDAVHLQNFLLKCMQADKSYKSGNLTQRLALELLVRSV